MHARQRLSTQRNRISGIRFGVLAIAVGLIVAIAAAPAAQAKQPPVTKLTFKLDAHSFVVGDTITSSIKVQTREGNHWAPLPGAELTVKLDGAEVATVVADDSGMAAVSWVATAEGDHVMKVAYAGDDLHKRARRAQGFSVEAA